MDIDKMEACRELDALVAERVMGWLKHERYGLISVPPYSTDISAAWQMEDRIAELGLIEEYCFQLNSIANAHLDRDYFRQPQRWQLIHATPEDRCRAALKAVEMVDVV